MRAVLYLVGLITVIGLVLLFLRHHGVAGSPRGDPKLSAATYAAAATTAPPKRSDEKRIVWIMQSWVPNVRAGSEITAEAQIAHLRAHGWTVFVLVSRWAVPEYKGVPIYPFQKGRLTAAPGIVALLKSADIICSQNYSATEVQQAVAPFGKPVVVFLHTEFDEQDILQYRLGVPLYVVYNVNYLKLEMPNTHPSIVVHPKVDTAPFKFDKSSAVTASGSGYVTLVNCNPNKGGDLLPKLARALPDVQFLGIQGGYGHQVLDPRPPPNLTYRKTQTDMAAVYAKTKILIMPSTSETWGRTAVEAMASGTPVIVSRSPGLLECVGKAEMSCDRNDVSCWVEKIHSLTTDAQAYDEASRRARDRIAELDSETEFERLGAFLDDIARRHAEPAAKN